MDKPRVVTLFGKHREWYIIPGEDSNYCYAYTKSDLVYMVTQMRVEQKGTIVLYNAKLNRMLTNQKIKNMAYLGNHIDFSIHNDQVDVYYKTHWTEYFERNIDLNTFERRADDICTFKTPLLSRFGKTQCINRQDKPLYQLDYIFTNKSHQSIIEDLWKASNAMSLPIKKGGTPREPYGYKGIDSRMPDFFEFMNDTIFRKLWIKMKHTPLYVYQYFDEGNELDAMGNKTIQYVVEFEETRTIAFAISSHRALKACWTNINKDLASVREKRALVHWHRECTGFLDTNFYL
jgi:hypothetical protein